MAGAVPAIFGDSVPRVRPSRGASEAGAVFSREMLLINELV